MRCVCWCARVCNLNLKKTKYINHLTKQPHSWLLHRNICNSKYFKSKCLRSSIALWQRTDASQEGSRWINYVTSNSEAHSHCKNGLKQYQLTWRCRNQWKCDPIFKVSDQTSPFVHMLHACTAQVLPPVAIWERKVSVQKGSWEALSAPSAGGEGAVITQGADVALQSCPLLGPAPTSPWIVCSWESPVGKSLGPFLCGWGGQQEALCESLPARTQPWAPPAPTIVPHSAHCLLRTATGCRSFWAASSGFWASSWGNL